MAHRVLLGSAFGAHPLIRQINVERTAELLAGADPTQTGLVLGMHGADLANCAASWEEMAEEVLDEVIAENGLAAGRGAPLEEVGTAVNDYLTRPGACLRRRAGDDLTRTRGPDRERIPAVAMIPPPTAGPVGSAAGRAHPRFPPFPGPRPP